MTTTPIVTAPDTLLTMKDVGRRLGVTERTVFSIIARGELRACRIGQRSVRIAPAELARYIAAAQAAPELVVA